MTKRTVVLIAFLLSASLTATQQSSTDLYQQGLTRETAGDIKGAIEIFERIVRDHSANRVLTARALVQLGRWADLLGQDQARKHYERVIREFADQTDAVAEARNRLAALGAVRPTSALTARRVDAPLDLTSSLMPDGKLAAITDWTTGDLAVYDMSSGEKRRLMASAGWPKDGRFEPTFGWVEGGVLSPDLKQVAYTWSTPPGPSQSYQLRVMPNQPGAPPRILVNSPESVYFIPTAWSRDGQSILAHIWKPDRSMHLAWISAADGTIRVLKSLARRTSDRVSLSPDGRYIAYSFRQRPDTVNSSIYVMAADGTGETELVGGSSINEAPAWTPDSTRVFFTSNRSGRFGLWSIAVRNGAASGGPDLVKPDIGRILAIGFTSAGTYYYLHVTPTRDLYVAELNPADSKLRGSAVALTDAYTGSRLPAWSPDGKAVAFVRETNPSALEDNDLVVRFMETSQERTYAGADVTGQPIWLPEGKSLLISTRRQNRPSLQRLNLETGEYTLVLEKDVRQGALTSDGRTLYAAVDKTVLAVDVASGRERQLFVAPVPNNINALALSPDGRTLALALERRTVGLVGVDGSGFRELPANGVRQVVWTRDGRAILFEAFPTGPGNRKLMRLPIDGSEPEFTGVDLEGVFSLTSDGIRLVFVKSRDTLKLQRRVEVWALDNLLVKPGR